MDPRPVEVPTATSAPPVPAVPAPAPGPLPTWPRSVQVTVGVLLAAALVFLVGQRLLQIFTAGPADPPTRRVDLNQADQAELLLLPGIGPVLAERILHHRRAHGPFANVDDLRRIPGIGPATLERVRSWILVGEPDDSPAALAPATAPKPVVVLDAAKKGAKPKKGTNLTAAIDVNTAGLADLQKLPGIGPKLSQRIVDERAKKPFSTIDDLKRVRGIGKKTVDKLRPFVTVGATAPATGLAGGQ